MPVGQREPAARRRSIAEPALFDLSRRCRCTEVDDPCTEYAPKQFYIKMVFRNSSRGRRPRADFVTYTTNRPDEAKRHARGRILHEVDAVCLSARVLKGNCEI